MQPSILNKKVFYVYEQQISTKDESSELNLRLIGVFTNSSTAISVAKNEYNTKYNHSISNMDKITKTPILIFEIKLNELIPQPKSMNLNNLVWWHPYGTAELPFVLPDMFPKEIKTIICKYVSPKKPLYCPECKIINLAPSKLHPSLPPNSLKCVNCCNKIEYESWLINIVMDPKVRLCPIQNCKNQQCRNAHDEKNQTIILPFKKDPNMKEPPIYRARFCNRTPVCDLGINCLNAHSKEELRPHLEIDPNELF